MAKKHLKPQFYDDDDDLDTYLEQEAPSSDEGSDDELAKLSFGSLKTAQDKLDQEEQKLKKSSKTTKKPVVKPELKKVERPKKVEKVKAFSKPSDSEDDESDDEGFFDNESDSEADDDNDSRGYGRGGKDKKKGKHAPKETSSKKKVSRIREIPGLVAPRQQTSLYQDIRFDTAFGKADQDRVRKDYKFLDEYRQKEIDEINAVLKNPKLKNKLSYREIEDLEYKAKSLRSRLESLKNRDMQKEVLEKYKQEHKGKNKYYLKESEKRKILQKHKFENMKASQREKVVERKRKRRLGKEFKELEFNRPTGA